ncbi:MAG: hypothetical protein M3Y59_04110 [Myxococcota bacterium]|nr:hypothetical protein [Myxococcota bacterium]
MRHWVRWVAVAGVAGALLTGCSLRPRYLDLVSGVGEGPAEVVLTDSATGGPLAGVAVSYGEGKDRIMLATDENGAVIVPRDPKVEQQNPIVVVARPAGVVRYTFVSRAAQAQPEPRPIHIPEGGVGPGQPSDLNRPDETPSAPPLPEPDAPAPDAGN